MRILALALLCAGAAPATADPRRDFLQAEEAIAAGRTAEVKRLIDALSDYPLTPYLELAWAERRLAVVSHEEVARVLDAHGGIPLAFSLRRAWLERLARDGRHDLLLRYHEEDGHVASACLAAQAQWRTGRHVQAWQRVARLWSTGESLPDACDPVLAAWRQAGELTPQRAWERFVLATHRGNLRLARYLQRFLPPEGQGLARSWLALRAAPAGLAAFAQAGDPGDPRRAQVIEDVFRRAARHDPAAARSLLAELEATPLLPAPLAGALRETLGIALARAGHGDALRWLTTARSDDALAWRAAAALRAGDHEALHDAVASMSVAEASRERWRYWRARALHALGRPEGLRELEALAGERSYYGFSAADLLDRPYRMQHRPLTVAADLLDAVNAAPEVRRAAEWLALDRTREARREWHRLLVREDGPPPRAAAVIAHGWGWHEAAIRAAAAAREWDDLDLRFPRAHRELVRKAAAASDLPEARIYAVLRQESAFMSDARSSAGALGLMQLLPVTARQVAREARRPRPGARALMAPAENLMLGSLYLAGLERRYAGHPVLASAAYNAGPGRVRDWRPAQAPVSSAIWIETVPFRETRRYLRSVLAYHVIYAERLGETPPRLRDLMPPVPP